VQRADDVAKAQSFRRERIRITHSGAQMD
jgi:hypothetical protein